MSDILHKEENRLPKNLLIKAIKSGNEFGWRQADFCNVVEAARQIPMAVIGGQIQYVLSDGTFELHWLSYDSIDRYDNEDWLTFCNRTAKECSDNFNTLISTIDIEKEALESFELLNDKKKSGVNIDKYKTFILYFNDSETDSYK